MDEDRAGRRAFIQVTLVAIVIVVVGVVYWFHGDYLIAAIGFTGGSGIFIYAYGLKRQGRVVQFMGGSLIVIGLVLVLVDWFG